ncbi:MAG: ABC transporter permease [Rhizobiales bacterium]|nr:ABC transporter permease [Hyphomicrobiales bacterium]
MLSPAPYAMPLERVLFYAGWAFTALVLLFLIAPILAVIPLSFNAEPYFSYPMPGLSLQWYRDFFGNDRWTGALLLSIKLAVTVTIASTVLGTMAALGLSRTQLPLRALILGLLLLPMIVPVIIIAVAVFMSFGYFGLIGTFAGLALAHTALATPFVVITVTSTLTSFDWTLQRAAQGLGATSLFTFRKVILPLILPGIVTGAIFAFVTSFDEVVVALFLASAEQRTLPKQMFSGIREMISPTITAAATVQVVFSVCLLVGAEFLRRRSERLRGVTPA